MDTEWEMISDEMISEWDHQCPIQKTDRESTLGEVIQGSTHDHPLTPCYTARGSDPFQKNREIVRIINDHKYAKYCSTVYTSYTNIRICSHFFWLDRKADCLIGRTTVRLSKARGSIAVLVLWTFLIGLSYLLGQTQVDAFVLIVCDVCGQVKSLLRVSSSNLYLTNPYTLSHPHPNPRPHHEKIFFEDLVFFVVNYPWNNQNKTQRFLFFVFLQRG